MKKATAATVAQSIKSTKQLSQLQGLAPAKSCKPPLKSSCSALQIDADQANLHLDLLGLDETCTNIRLIPHKGRRGGAINGIFAKDLDRAQDLNRQGYGVYVQVNIASGTKSDDVTACTALFCEWDDRPVDDQLVLWQSLGLPEPTFMVMTGGKSVHLYWVLTVPIEPERWVPLIDRLVAYADSDRSCKGLNRMMRLAGGYYIDRDGEAKSITQIVNVTGYCYEAAQFEELLPLLPSGMTCRRAPRKFSSTPASLRQITEALDCIPRRLEGAGTYAVYRNILWGLVDACAEAGYGKDFAAKSSCIHLNTGSLNFVDAPKNSPILEKNMNKVIIKLLPLLLLLAGESSAQTVTYDVSFGGTDYTLGRGNMRDYSLSELEIIWTPQPWYGNSILSENLSLEVGFGLGGENGTYPSTHHNGVFFGYGVDTNSGTYQAVRTEVGIGPGHFNWGNARYYFAVDCSVSSSFCSSDDGDSTYSISGDRYVGTTLSANRDSDDPDGNGSITGYTWQSSSDGSTWSTVGTDSTYSLTDSEEGKYLRLTVAYTDGKSFSESVTTSNVQAKDFTTAMAKPFAALKSNNLEIVNSYVKNSLLSSQQSCSTQGVEIFDGKACVHGNYFHTNRYTFGDSGNNSFQAHQTSGNYGFDYQVTDGLNIGLRYGSGTSGMDNDTNITGTTSQASVVTNHWGLKATYEGEKNVLLSSYLGFTDFDVDLDRQSTTNDSTTTSAKSSFDGDAYSAGIKIAKVIPIKSNAVLVSELSATYSTYEQPQIVEIGSGDLLTVDRTDSQSLLMRIGGKAVQSLKTNQGRYDASVYLGVWYEFDPYSTRNGEHQVSAQFTESSAAAVSSSSQSVQAQKVNFEAGGAVQLSDQIQLTLNGGLDLAADVSNSYVRGGVSWAF